MRLGLDLGGTKTDAVAIDRSNAVIGRVRLRTETGVAGVIETVAAAVEALAALPGIDRAEFRSVGIGMPGQVVPGSSVVTQALNLQVRDLDVVELIAPRLGLQVRVENDVKAAAIGAFALDDQQAHSLAYLNIGTGVAAGTVIGGRLWRGQRGAAGEIGHISIDPAGPRCVCGDQGCIEAFAGGGAIAARWGRPAELPVLEVFDAADAGDPRAREVRADIARAVAAAVRILILSNDVDMVVLGGGLTALRQRLLPDIYAVLDASAERSAFLRSLRLSERIRVIEADSPAAALGAAIIGGESNEEIASEREFHG